MATAINNSIRETGGESYLDDDEGALEFVASARVCESRPPLARRRKLRRSVIKATVLLASSRFSTSQSYTSSSLTRSTRQWHGNSDDSRTTRRRHEEAVSSRQRNAVCVNFFSPRTIPLLPLSLFPHWDVVFLTGLFDGVICRHCESITRKSRFTRYAKRTIIDSRCESGFLAFEEFINSSFLLSCPITCYVIMMELIKFALCNNDDIIKAI